MKTALLTGLTALALAFGFTAASPATPVDDSETALYECMEGIKTHLKGTAMALRDSKMPDALEHIGEIERLLLLAKREEPANLADIPEDARAEHIAAFRKDLALALKAFLDMEIDVLEGKTEAAFARVSDPLYPMREAAHAKYQKQD